MSLQPTVFDDFPITIRFSGLPPGCLWRALFHTRAGHWKCKESQRFQRDPTDSEEAPRQRPLNRKVPHDVPNAEMSLQPTVFDGFLVTIRAAVFFDRRSILASAEMTVFVRVSAAFPRETGLQFLLPRLNHMVCKSPALGMLYE